MVQIVLKFILFLALFSFHSLATAACGYVKVDGTFPPLSFSDIDNANSSVGSSLWTTWTDERTAILQVNYTSEKCTSAGGWSTWVSRVGLPTTIGWYNGYPLYPTEYDNIAYALTAKDPNRSEYKVGDRNTKLWSTSAAVGTTSALHLGFTVKMAFVFLGPVRAGEYYLAGRKIGNIAISNNANSYSPVASTMSELRYNGFTMKVTGATCELDVGDKDQTVNLPSVSQSAFTKAGATTGATSFSLRLINCPDGITAYASVVDANNQANNSKNLSLSSGSTASGVAVQIMQPGSSDAVTLGHTNQWYVAGSSTATTSTHIIPLISRYVKTGTTVNPGSVVAKATIAFFYQ